ncbi:hypothetical protein R9C00_14620 [Flammeovirgaceae bacterium SG7u.111]|nr:hypothetical protein [Flammeovirgaceae bacterium SG7u.132]WPO38692.1 hypothetical protein R9C00_14620 [Flammeovirgaceae bacterium SG7u.111]
MKQLISIFLASLILMGNMGFTLATHFCGGQAVETELAIGVHELACGMSEPSAKASGCEKEAISEKSCCDDEVISVDNGDEFKQSLQKLTFDHKVTLTFVYSFLKIYFPSEETYTSFTSYSPPLSVAQDYYVLFQSFLL